MSYTALSHGGVARVSTLIVDAQLDTGAFGIKADRIEESTAGAGVTISPGKWTSLDLSASDNVRAYDDTEVYVPNKEAYYRKTSKVLTIPARYTSGQTCRVSYQIKSTKLGKPKYVRVYVNGVAVGPEHMTDSLTFVTFTDDIPVGGGDTVELWVNTGEWSSGGDAWLGEFTVRGDDSMPDVLFTVGQSWP